MDLLVHNAKVYLSRGNFAQAVWIHDGVIQQVGGSRALKAAAPSSAASIDAQGRLLVPGFYDCHQHLAMAGRNAFGIHAAAPSLEALIATGRATVTRLGLPPDTWITGTGWDEAQLGRYPTRDDLDAISTQHPIALSRKCCHVFACNSRALERAGLDPTTHTGILAEKDAYNLLALIPPATDDEVLEHIRYSVRKNLANGFTAVASNDVSGGDIQRYKALFARLLADPLSQIRISEQCSIAGTDAQFDELLQAGFCTGTSLIDDFVKVGPLKLFADGALGARTALLRADYSDDPGNRGQRALEPSEHAYFVRKAARTGWQVVTHAIGDGGVEMVLDSYEQVTSTRKTPNKAKYAQTSLTYSNTLRSVFTHFANIRCLPGDPERNPLRHGVNHCSITGLDLLERFAANDILALIQPVFLSGDHRFILDRVGAQRASTSYAWGTMERLGIHTAYGTDCPVEEPRPIANIAEAVNRSGFNPAQSVDVATALDAQTLGSAYANFDEKRLGRIASGYLADLVLLSDDLFTLPPQDIATTTVTWTMVNGKIVYEAQGDAD